MSATISDQDLDSFAWVVWELRVRDPLGFAPEEAVARTQATVRTLASSLGCVLADFGEDNDGDDGEREAEAACWFWLVRVPQAEHRRRDEHGVPEAVSRVRRELQSLLPAELGDWHVEPDWQLTLLDDEDRVLRALYADLLTPFEDSLRHLRADGAEDLEPRADLWVRGEQEAAGTYALWLCQDPDFGCWLVLSVGLAVADAAFWEGPTGEGLLMREVKQEDPILLMPRPAAAVWMASLEVGTFSRTRLRPGVPAADVPGARHQWTSGDPLALAACVSRDLLALLPRLASREAPTKHADAAQAGPQSPPVTAGSPQVQERLARILARKAGMSQRQALSLVAEATGEGVLPARLDPAGLRQALDLLLQRHAAAATAQGAVPEPCYRRLEHVGHGRLRPGVSQRIARAAAAGVSPVRSWGDLNPVDTVGAVMLDNGDDDLDTDWWQRVAAAGPRPDCILPDPYQGHRSPDGAVPVDAALEQRGVTGDLAGYHRALVAIVRSEPRDVDAWAHLGNYYLDLADPATSQPPGAPVPDSRRRRSWVQTALGCYQTAIGAAELALPDPFGGLLTWSHLENRPFFRAMHGMGAALWQTDRLDDAEQVLLNMLWLNPADNQGARDLLAAVRAGTRRAGPLRPVTVLPGFVRVIWDLGSGPNLVTWSAPPCGRHICECLTTV